MHCLRRHQTTKQIIFIFIIWISSHCDDIDKVLQVPFLSRDHHRLSEGILLFRGRKHVFVNRCVQSTANGTIGKTLILMVINNNYRWVEIYLPTNNKGLEIHFPVTKIHFFF
jgi:hypothetical protein